MLITDWVFVDIKKLCDVFRGDDGVVFMFFFFYVSPKFI